MKKILFIADLILILFFVLRFSSLPPQIPLFYSLPWGEDQLVDNWMILILPVTMNFLFFINYFFYSKYFQGNIFIKKIVDYLSLFTIISLSFIFIKIVLLVT